MKLLSGYYCVFVGKPEHCTPYALFSSRQQAALHRDEIGGRHKIMTLREWEEIYIPRPTERARP